MGIDWDGLLGGSFVKLEVGEPKDLLVSNWRPQEAFKDDDGKLKPGIVLDVHMEDGKEFEDYIKTWTVTSIRALAKLRPILESREDGAKVGIRVIKTGQGKSTQYDIKEV